MRKDEIERVYHDDKDQFLLNPQVRPREDLVGFLEAEKRFYPSKAGKVVSTQKAARNASGARHLAPSKTVQDEAAFNRIFASQNASAQSTLGIRSPKGQQ